MASEARESISHRESSEPCLLMPTRGVMLPFKFLRFLRVLRRLLSFCNPVIFLSVDFKSIMKNVSDPTSLPES